MPRVAGNTKASAAAVTSASIVEGEKGDGLGDSGDGASEDSARRPWDEATGVSGPSRRAATSARNLFKTRHVAMHVENNPKVVAR